MKRGSCLVVRDSRFVTVLEKAHVIIRPIGVGLQRPQNRGRLAEGVVAGERRRAAEESAPPLAVAVHHPAVVREARVRTVVGTVIERHTLLI